MSVAAPELTRVLVVTGPTAAGKTELAAAIARALGCEIIGADSRQVYRYMDAGTAKPSAELRAEVPHHLVDVVNPDEPYDAATWRTDALAALKDIEARGARAIVCGGTGLYIRSLTRGLFAGPAADLRLRAELERDEQAEPGALHARLRTLDPDSAARIHANDLVRLVRALEVLRLTGKPISAWQREHALAQRLVDSLTLAVALERVELARRIDERSRGIVEAGIVEELSELWSRGYAPSLKAFDAIGYREAARTIRGELAPGALAAEVAKATRAYAKRQLVWIRAQCEAVPVHAFDTATAIELARRFFERVANR